MVDTPRHGHAPIPMVFCPNEDRIKAAGEFTWQVDPATLKRVLILGIPYNNPCGFIHSEWTIDHKNDCGASWSWSGKEGCPTLSPSLHAVGIWHGYVRDGKLVEA